MKIIKDQETEEVSNCFLYYLDLDLLFPDGLLDLDLLLTDGLLDLDLLLDLFLLPLRGDLDFLCLFEVPPSLLLCGDRFLLFLV